MKLMLRLSLSVRPSLRKILKKESSALFSTHGGLVHTSRFLFPLLSLARYLHRSTLAARLFAFRLTARAEVTLLHSALVQVRLHHG